MDKIIKVKKATRKELIDALTHLTEWATGTNKDGVTKQGNPYCKQVVANACRLLSMEKGRTSWTNWDEK